VRDATPSPLVCLPKACRALKTRAAARGLQAAANLRAVPRVRAGRLRRGGDVLEVPGMALAAGQRMARERPAHTAWSPDTDGGEVAREGPAPTCIGACVWTQPAPRRTRQG